MVSRSRRFPNRKVPFFRRGKNVFKMWLPGILAWFLGVLTLVGLTLGVEEQVETNPDFLGCYKDDKWLDENFRLTKSRALPYEVESFSNKQDCVDQCAFNNFLYAGLQNGYLCFCGNFFDVYGRADDSECNLECRKPNEPVTYTDNMFDSCGGRWRNSVYSVSGVQLAEEVAALKWWQGRK